MKIKIINVKANGDLERERVVIKVLADDDIGHYILLDTTYNGNTVSNKIQHPYWVPDTEVKRDDLVVIYTKKGVDKTVKNSSDSNTHFLYRGLEKSIWNKDGDCAIIMDIKEWLFFPVKENE
jgi:hypothetical protein